MKIWCKDSDGNLIRENGCPLSDKTLLILPGNAATDKKKSSISAYIKTAESLLLNKKNINVHLISWTEDIATNQEIINYNSNPRTYFNNDTEKIVNKIFLPILSDEKKLFEFHNLTIFAASYGSVATGMLENCLNKTMTELGYSEDKQKEIMGKICVVSVVPVTNIHKKPAMFKQVFFAPSNDKKNSLYNLEATHISPIADKQPYYEKIGESGLLISAPIPTLLFDEKASLSDPLGHIPRHALRLGHNSLPSSLDVFPVLIPVVLNNAILRDENIHDLTSLLHPVKPKTTVSDQDGYGFRKRVEDELITRFIHDGGVQPFQSRLH